MIHNHSLHLLVASLTISACVDLPLFSVVTAEYQGCDQYAVVWEEHSPNGEVERRQEFLCTEVVAAPSQYPEGVVDACMYRGLTAPSGCGATADGSIDALADVQVDAVADGDTATTDETAVPDNGPEDVPASETSLEDADAATIGDDSTTADMADDTEEEVDACAADETCGDGLDNDCDGATDEECLCNFQNNSDGVCAGQVSGIDGSCPVPAGFEASESLCDDIDNDCDGETDEGCPCGLLGVACPTGFQCDEATAAATYWPAFCVSSDGAEVFVPGGTFWRGCTLGNEDYCADDEVPAHITIMSAYRIDRLEVTAADYKACVSANWPGCTEPTAVGGTYGTYAPAPKQTHPINYVSWGNAAAYCEFAGRRLCTEAEWEMAAGGSCSVIGEEVGNCADNDLVLPWGGGYSCDYAIILESGSSNNSGCGDGTTWPVGSKPAGASPYGALDMIGNVTEWTQDIYSATEAYEACATEGVCSDPVFTGAGTSHVIRGGHFGSGYPDDFYPPENQSKVSARASAESPDEMTGFRCCSDP